MPTSQIRVIQEDFGGGMVRDVAGHLIPDDACYDIRNGIIADDGAIYRRGGSEYHSGSAFGSRLNFLWDGYLTPGRRTVTANSSDFGVLAGDDSTMVNLGGPGVALPTTATELEGLLFIGGGYIYGGSRLAAAYSTGTVTTVAGTTVTGSGTTWTSNVDAGMIFQTASSERVYVVESVTDDTHLELRDAYEGTPGAGVSYTLSPIYTITSSDPYDDSMGYATSTNRLISYSDHYVYFTDLRSSSPIANPHSRASTNYHHVPEGVEVLGVATQGQTVIIFTTGGVWALNGLAFDIVSPEGTPQHQLDPISRDIVLWATEGVASWEQTLVVPATDGIYLVDGISAPRRISKQIDPLYRKYVENGWTPGGATVYRGHYFLPILDGAGNVEDMLVCRLDRAVLDRRRRTAWPWVRLDGTGAEIAQFVVRQTSEPATPTLLGAAHNSSARILDLSEYLDPASSNKNDADGTTHELSVVTRDYETGALTKNHIRRLRLGYELLDSDSDDPRLLLEYGDGNRIADAPEWGHSAGSWGTGFGPLGTSTWTASADGEFTIVSADGSPVYAPETRLEPFSWRIAKFKRHIRFRIRSDEDRPSKWCELKRIEVFIRPSKAVRK